jgi:serine/threonine protein kinase
VVEITPEREYTILMEFYDGAVEIGDAEVTPAIIDEGLELVMKLWNEGVAHRDIKPANLMVQDGELRVIDVFFAQVRPSPWRQAVDLANMMLVLALRTDAPTVYERALRIFTADEIAEAFAATRGVASPSQLRNELRADDRDLIAEFRRLAPARTPVRIQRWSVRRIALTAGVTLVLLLMLLVLAQNWAVFA